MASTMVERARHALYDALYTATWSSSMANTFLPVGQTLQYEGRKATFTCGGHIPIVMNPNVDESGNLTPRTGESVSGSTCSCGGASSVSRLLGLFVHTTIRTTAESYGLC